MHSLSLFPLRYGMAVDVVKRAFQSIEAVFEDVCARCIESGAEKKRRCACGSELPEHGSDDDGLEDAGASEQSLRCDPQALSVLNARLQACLAELEEETRRHGRTACRLLELQDENMRLGISAAESSRENEELRRKCAASATPERHGAEEEAEELRRRLAASDPEPRYRELLAANDRVYLKTLLSIAASAEPPL